VEGGFGSFRPSLQGQNLSPVAVGFAPATAVALAKIHAEQIAPAGGRPAIAEETDYVFEKPAHDLLVKIWVNLRPTAAAKFACSLNFLYSLSRKIQREASDRRPCADESGRAQERFLFLPDRGSVIRSNSQIRLPLQVEPEAA
jgi:hypothetical protein